MKIETQPREDHQITITAEFGPEVMEQYQRRAARKLAQRTTIPGFRPGKAPFDIVRRHVGEEALTEQAIELIVDEKYPEILKEAAVEPYTSGSLEDVVSIEPLTLRFVVPLKPTVNLGAYRELRQDYQAPAVEETEVDSFLDRMRQSQAILQPAERPAQEGDLVFATVSARRTDAAEGEPETLAESRPVQAMVRPADQQPKNEWPFPGFGMDLLGLSAGDEKTITHTFDEDSIFENLKGKTAEFMVKVDSIKALELPEMDDSFAQTLGQFETMNDLRNAVRESLESNTRGDYERDYFNTLFDKLAEQATIAYPPQALQEEIDSVLSSLRHDLGHQNLDLETYVKLRQTDMQTFIDEEVKPVAVSRLRRELIMQEIARAEQIQLSNEELQAAFSETLSEAAQDQEFDKMRKQLSSERLSNMLVMEAASRAMSRRVLDRLKQIAAGIEPEATPEDDGLDEELDEELTDLDQPETAESSAPAADAGESAAAAATAGSEEPPAAGELVQE